MVSCNACLVDIGEKDAIEPHVFIDGKEVDVEFALERAAELKVRSLKAYLEDEADSHPKLPGWEFTYTLVKQTIKGAKVFDGDEEDAEAAGWVENEFGWVCAECTGSVGEYGTSVETGDEMTKLLQTYEESSK